MSKVENGVVSSNEFEMVPTSDDLEIGRKPVTKTHTWTATKRHSITWNKVSWEVNVKKLFSESSTKQILKNVSGYVESGSVKIKVPNIFSII